MMQKEFNDTGLCIPGKHYMADTSRKIEAAFRLVEKGKYFTVTRPRQYGKTTTLFLLMKQLFATEDYLPLRISFERLGEESYTSQKRFLEGLWSLLRRFFQANRLDVLKEYSDRGCPENFEQLDQVITDLCIKSGKQTVLMIDEVDKSSNNQLFLDFLALLRAKYLLQNEGQDVTFYSVILAGVHDVKTLKAKIRPDAERKYNSPWNIAADFDANLSFSPQEIGTMLRDYCDDRQVRADIPAISQKLYYYTSGYPYLVSKLCKFIDEKIVPAREDKNWSVADADQAFRMIVNESYTTTLFDSLAKNLENNHELYGLVSDIVINGKQMTFTATNPVIHLASLYGILSESEGICAVHNRIYEQKIYAHIMSGLLIRERTEPVPAYEFFTDSGLDMRLILQRFQTFMKEHHSHKDQKFLEREGRLLFLSFLRPVINGRGFDFKEPNVAEERRMDLVVTYKNTRYVVELKRWRGPKAHEEGLRQLSSYLDTYSLKQGYLLIYDFSKTKTYKEEDIRFGDKDIFAVWV
jgi:hypothetical protein